jgi:hypothetical protein
MSARTLSTLRVLSTVQGLRCRTNGRVTEALRCQPGHRQSPEEFRSKCPSNMLPCILRAKTKRGLGKRAQSPPTPRSPRTEDAIVGEAEHDGGSSECQADLPEVPVTMHPDSPAVDTIQAAEVTVPGQQASNLALCGYRSLEEGDSVVAGCDESVGLHAPLTTQCEGRIDQGEFASGPISRCNVMTADKY